MPTVRPARLRAAALAIPFFAAACGASSAAQSPAGSPAQAAAASSAASRVPSGFIVVANQQSANASIIELPSGDTTLVPVGAGPHEAAITADGRFAVVTVYGTQVPGNQLAVIDLSTKQVVRTIDLGEFRRPHGVVALAEHPDLVAVTSEVARHVVIVNVATGEVESAIPTESRGSHMVAVTADGKRGFTANIPDGSVSELNLDRPALVRVSPVSTMTEGVAVTPDGAEVWVGSNDAGTVSVLDTRTNQVVATITGFTFPYRLGISPDGRLAVVCDPEGSAIHVVDVKSRRILGALTGLGSPRGVFIAPDSRTAFVTLNASSEVAAVDLETREILARYPVGASPDGVAFAGR